jgi:hypothetical protein
MSKERIPQPQKTTRTPRLPSSMQNANANANANADADANANAVHARSDPTSTNALHGAI